MSVITKGVCVRVLQLSVDSPWFASLFLGSHVIDWLLSSNFIQNRQEGLMVASALLNEGYFQPAGDVAKSAVEGLTETSFLDDEDAYYYFVSVKAWAIFT